MKNTNILTLFGGVSFLLVGVVAIAVLSNAAGKRSPDAQGCYSHAGFLSALASEHTPGVHDLVGPFAGAARMALELSNIKTGPRAEAYIAVDAAGGTALFPVYADRACPSRNYVLKGARADLLKSSLIGAAARAQETLDAGRQLN